MNTARCTRMIPRWALAAAVAGVGAVGLLAMAGPLNPPAGPVSPTYKTLAEVEPRTPVQALPGSATAVYVISQPGSYYLTGNITGQVGKHGLLITADRVTIDLNGFALTGVPGSLDGVRASGGRAEVVVKDGTVRNWGGRGINFSRNDNQDDWADRTRIEGVVAANNGGSGIAVWHDALVMQCTASSNGQQGVTGEERVVVSECTASFNAGTGITVFVGGNIARCVAKGNSEGIGCAYAGQVADCSAYDNGAGIVVYAGCLVSNCSANGNGTVDIAANFDDCVIQGCEAGRGGIRMGSRCRVAGNRLTGQGNGAGIRTHQPTRENDCTVEDNTVIGFAVGIQIEGQNNFIARNKCRGNATNYAIGAGNSYGPIVNVAGVGDISTVPNANHPWANFSY